MTYGIPYKGSKNKIAREIIEQIPAADCFIDLFAGGCAITHAALLSGKFKRIIANDVQVQYPLLFRDAWTNKLPAQFNRFVSREEFFAKKDKDAIVATCFSFGNDCCSYLYNPQREKVKGLAHRMIVAEDWKERRKLYMAFVKALKESIELVNELERIQGLEGLEGD